MLFTHAKYLHYEIYLVRSILLFCHLNCLLCNSGGLPSHSGFRVQPNFVHLGIPSLGLNLGLHLYFNMAFFWYSGSGSSICPFDITGTAHVISV